MSRIDRLTPGQATRLGETYQEWLAVGRSCEPLDRAEVCQIVNEFYSCIGKPKPAVMFFGSPAMCIVAWGVLRRISTQLGGQLGDQLRDQLRDQLGDQLRDQLWGQLGDQLWGQLGDQLGDQLGGQLRDQLGVQLWGQLSNYFGGQHWCSWAVFYSFCAEIGVKYPGDAQTKLDRWLRQSRGMHWWFPYSRIVLVSERHVELNLDDRGRLHSGDRMACRYSDGWGVYAWHGTRMPAQYYDQPVTTVAILAERNAEVRRALIERYGQDRFMLDSGARVIDADPDHGAELLAIDLPEDPDGRMVALKLRCPSTSAVYVVRVPPEMTHARAALAWSYGMGKPEEYVLAAET